MPLDSCIIDGTDIASLGMFIERGGSNDLLAFPNRRTPDFNDWAEYDGLEVDLTDCTFDAKTVKIKYILVADDKTLFKQHLNRFENLHFAHGMRDIYVREYNRNFLLRFVGFSGYEHRGGLKNSRKKIGKITAEYSMDNPLQIFTQAISAPISLRNTLTEVKLNGFDLSAFGIVVQDIYSSALQPYSSKSRLVTKVQNLTGEWADVGTQFKKEARQLTIKCTMLADTLNDFYVNYNALFNNLRITTPVELELSQAGKVIRCYYSKMVNFSKETVFSKKIKVSFNLILQEL